MTKPLSYDLSREKPAAHSESRQIAPPSDERRLADAEMARVLGTEPFRVALDSSGGGIAHWKHDPLHDVVEPMTHHVIMSYNGAVQRMERRSGRFASTGTFRPGVVTIIPEGSSSRWDIPKPVDVVQLYLPHRTLVRVAAEADTAKPIDLLERTAHPDPWLREHRLEQAMQMLRDTDASIVTVAAALGYASQTAFAAAFKRLTGDTPTDWRRRER